MKRLFWLRKLLKRYASLKGVRIQHYHVENGHFADKGFVNHCQDENQTLTYCGVNAYFQNGVAEKKVRDLQEKTWTCLLYAMHKWPRMIIANLWPYALRYVNHVANATPNKGEEITPLEKFSSVSVAPKLRHFHSFGCPAYVLDNALQSGHGQGLPKWSSRSRLGVYLGASPNHARSVAWILSPRTGQVSPQFHVKFDDFLDHKG